MTEGKIDARLLRLLGGDEHASLRQRLRRLSQLSPIEHRALASLAGKPGRLTGSMQIDLAAIDAALARAGIAASLRDALERLDGPIVNRAQARREAVEQWSVLCEAIRQPALQRMLDDEAGRRLLRRLANQSIDSGRRLAERASAVLELLPAQGVPRSLLAAQALGDAHALDDGMPDASLVLAAWRAARGGTEPADPPRDETDEPAAAERARDIWASAGVLVNELARPVLVLNLPAFDQVGEPRFLSLRSLLRSPPAWRVAGRDIHVSENPNIVAWAADRLGAACAPIVCTDGMPAAAQRTLLAQLTEADARLHYHGDFDWPGIRIANWVIGCYRAQPWRMQALDYREAVRAAAQSAAGKHALSGSAVVANWDATLHLAMIEHGVAIAEEAVAESLLRDLGG